MSNWNKQKCDDQNKQKWGDALKEAHKTVMTKYKTKAKNILKGIRAAPSAIKKSLSKK